MHSEAINFISMQTGVKFALVKTGLGKYQQKIAFGRDECFDLLTAIKPFIQNKKRNIDFVLRLIKVKRWSNNNYVRGEAGRGNRRNPRATVLMERLFWQNRKKIQDAYR